MGPIDNIEGRDGEACIIVFGFPFSPKQISSFTGLGNGPGVVKRIADSTDKQLLLISRRADYYVGKDNIYPVKEQKHFEGTSESVAGVGLEELSSYSDLELSVYELLGRFSNQRRRERVLHPSEVYEYRRMIARNKIAYWHDLIVKRNIVGWINSNVPHFVDDLICYEVCRRHGIPTAFPYRMPIVPGVSARLYIPEGLNNHGQVYDREGNLLRFSDIDDDLAMQPLPEDLELIYQEVVLAGKSLGDLSKEMIARFGITPPKQFTPPSRSVLGFKSFLKAIWMRDLSEYKSHLISSRIANENSKDYAQISSSEIPQEKFIYYPLHMQPEASSCPLGGAFSDQLRAVRFLADNLPSGWILAVKEHPLQKPELRPLGWYKELIRSQNVQLISKDVPSSSLQKDCLAVATLTGAAAWEAWLWRKPSILMGNIIYQEAPGIYKIRNKEDLVSAYEKISSGVVHSNEDIRKFLGKLAIMTFQGHLDAYINPCLPSYVLDSEENDRVIGERLVNAIHCARVG